MTDEKKIKILRAGVKMAIARFKDINYQIRSDEYVTYLEEALKVVDGAPAPTKEELVKKGKESVFKAGRT